MIITESGRLVLQHAQRILAGYEELKSSLADETGTIHGRVAIGLPPTVSEALAVPLVAAVRDTHPQVTCRVISAYCLYLMDWTHKGDVEVAVLYDPQAIRSLKSEPLVREPFYVIGPPDAGLSLDSPVEVRRLGKVPLVLPGPEHSLRQIIENAALDASTKLDVVIDADSFSTLRRLVMDGYGWSVLTLAAVEDDIRAGRLTAAPLVDPVPERRLELVYSADRPLSRIAAFARDTISDTVTDLVRKGVWPNGTLLR
jgi:DNA-binding transcriptional LysR family regulator